MNLSLPPQIQKLIDERVRSGQYGSPEDVVAAAVATLDQQEKRGDFAPGELHRLLEDGEAGGDALDGDQVFAELRALRPREQGNGG
ncbi:MAG TPA: type II toxin-antitoxin system ParD family antitoxin [Tepidisphaeraceae bacterium]|nr:type II toxin-antitoxin system ParD family antitoxin [Tepidisphaeraceae bacterium]